MKDPFASELQQALARHLRKGAIACPKALDQSIRYSLLAPGKRIRPRLLMACSDMLGLKKSAALPAALALEMIHCFSLIHDDLPCMDDDDFRRGKPSNHKAFGEAIALLAGDALVPLAFETLFESAKFVPAPRVIAASQTLCRAVGAIGMIGGQAAEPALTSKARLPQIKTLHAAKTGALFEAAIVMPLNLASPQPKARQQKLYQFSRALGFAFQVADDLEDAVAEAKDPTNLLTHLSRPAAIKLARTPLVLAQTQLKQSWKKRADSLVSIAEEVIHKLA